MDVNVTSYGADPTGAADSTSAIQAAFDAQTQRTLAGGSGLVLYFPAGNYKISEPITFNGSDYAFLKLRIFGDGMFQSIIFQTDKNKDIFRFENTGAHYTADITFENLQMFYGRTAFYCDNFAYSSFDRVLFGHNGKHGDNPGGPTVDLRGNTIASQFRGCMWRHGGDPLVAERGSVHMADCTIGEDVGCVRVGGILIANGNYWKGSGVNKRDPDGWQGMGGASLEVVGEARAVLTGNSIGTITEGGAFANVDNGTLILQSNSIVLHNGTLARCRRNFNEHGVCVRGATLKTHGSNNQLITGVGNYTPRNAVIDGVYVDGQISCADEIINQEDNNVFGHNPGF